MRIFTLGKNGIPLFFFALILFSGTFSSYGQECPTVEEPDQDYCYLSTIATLEDDISTEDIHLFRTATSTNPIPENELLETGAYYVGDLQGTCANRPVVNVTVNSLPLPKSSIGNFFQPCEYGTDDADVSTVEDLSSTFTATQNDFVIQVFNEEFTGEPLANVQLISGNNYFVGQFDPVTGCSSPRIAINYDPVLSVAPTGEAEQSFCNAPGSPVPTIADLEASGNNRWYSTATSNPALDPSTPLVDGETYFASQITNRNNSDLPPCESTDRFAVTVDLTYTLIPEEQEFCASIGEGNDFGKPTIANLLPAGGEWVAEEDSVTPLESGEVLVDGEDYFLIDSDGDCQTIVVTAVILPTPNAGSTTQINVCQSEEAFNLVGRLNPSQLDAPISPNGTFNPALEDNMFYPSNYTPGSYTFTYIVPAIGECAEDRSVITVNVLEGPNAGEDTDLVLCQAELDAIAAEIIANPVNYQSIFVEMFGEDIRTDGTFSNNPFVFVQTYLTASEAGFDTPLSYTTDYTVTDETTSCSSTSTFTMTVNPTPNAGTSASIQLVEGETDVIDLFDELGPDAEEGGTWDNGNGSFDPTSDTPGTFTYTVTNSFGCSASATITVVAVPQDCPVVTDTAQEFCESVGTGNEGGAAAIEDLLPAGLTWYETATSTEPLAPTTVLVDGQSYFADNADGNCTARPEVVVTLVDAPSAGSTTSITVCSNEAPFDLVSRFRPSSIGPADPGGTFSPALASGNTIFDPAVDIARAYKYTVASTTDCKPDDAVITVNITEAPNAGADVSEAFCEDDMPTLEELLAYYADDNRDQTGTFSPSLESLAAAYAVNPFGTFETVYSVSANGCTDTANLSVTISEILPADAGENVITDVCSTAGVQNLSDFLTEDAIAGGVFSAPYEDGTFDPSTAGAEPVVITYTVNEDVACVTGEATSTITLTVIEGPDAGEDGNITLNVADAPVNLFDSLGGTPDEGGTWTPGNANGELDPSTLAAGEYTYVYTVTSANECEDTATVTVTIEGEVTCPVITNNEQSFCESILTGNDSKLPTVSDLLPAGATWYASADATEALPATTVLVNGTTYYAGNSNGTCEARESVTVTLDDSPNAGSTTQVTFCESDEPIDLLDVLNPSILGDADLGGTFSPALASGTTIFDPAVDAAGTYTYTVESTNDVCPRDTAVITITVTPNANAGEEISLEFCATQEAADLTELLPEGVDTNGTFEGLEGNVFNPADFEVGSHEFNYTVTVTGACESTDTSVVTVVVTEAPAAPAAEAQSFCVVDGATVADLVAGAEGDNLLWYTDESLETLADEADALVAGTYYVTNTTEGGCESAAAAVVVTLTDATAPSLTAGGNVFCEFNNPTLATLTANVTGGNITWYDAATGGNALTSTQPLQNGVTYYAASTDATSACESSVRLAVTVDLGDCPVIIPDAFSPNGDGINDRFEISYIADEFPNYTIEIFNRWGNVVFKGNASTPNWDGVSTESRSLGDKVLPVGVYFYIVNYNDGQTAPTQGRLYLSR